MGLVSKVIERVRAYYPYGSARFDDAELTKMVHAADCAVRERCELSWKNTDISLVANAIYYSLPPDVIKVHSVLYSSDGATFDAGVLKPATLRDFDTVYTYWRDSGGSTPEHYSVFSTPGVEGKAYLIVWPKLSSVSGEKVRVVHTYCYPNYTDAAFLVADDVDDWVLDACYVPHVLAQVYAQEDPKRAASLIQEFLEGARKAEATYANRYGEGYGVPRISGPGMTEGYLV